ncbi:tryptophan halogenase family protein [Teredinibacter waterburyi]|uniref:tryptophan halogenase family protein n=1 Tax=Teredinibacter waterburyi TaxID=1500538 RepID=UPI00165FF0E7|nr:tryptophan halogenase family protein [Teredinibacter waterburyi]
MIKHIVIVGGGTAGWLTAGILAAELAGGAESSVRITLIESPDVAAIGVGEGTWPTMRTTLMKIGLSETEFIRECGTSFKQGSKFVGWKTGAENDAYYHPFTPPLGSAGVNIAAAWKKGFGELPFADAVCLQSQISELGLAPKQITAAEYAGSLNYGYHLDAGKFSGLLQRHCVSKLGVVHILEHVSQIKSTDVGDIESLLMSGGRKVAGDLFIDCTGSSCLLLGQHMGVPFVDQSAHSINDSAIAIQVPYADEDSAIASSTIATAQSAGWTWDIGLSTRRGVGYVYSSSHINHDDAEKELRQHIAKSVGVDKAEELAARRIPIKAGHRAKFWQNNCVAVGMAAGFIEPLEASALALVELSANMIRDELPVSRDALPIVEKRFNKVFSYRWERIIEFLKLHYVLSERRDTEYWRDVTSPNSVPEGLQELLDLWTYREPYYNDMLHCEEIFPAASYEYVLFGMGFKQSSERAVRKSDGIAGGIAMIENNLRSVDRYAKVLLSNRELIKRINTHGLQRI